MKEKAEQTLPIFIEDETRESITKSLYLSKTFGLPTGRWFKYIPHWQIGNQILIGYTLKPLRDTGYRMRLKSKR